MTARRTPLYEEHKNLNARFVEFAGWEMPLLYTAILEEHRTARQNAALFDVSHMGEITVKGPMASAFLGTMIPTAMEKLKIGKSMYSVLCNDRGGVVDDLFIYMISPEEFFLVVNAGTRDKDVAWLKKHMIPDVIMTDISDDIAKIDLQGPASPEIACAVFGKEVITPLERFMFTKTSYHGGDVMISQSGYTGEKGYELYMSPGASPALWKELLKAGEKHGIKPAGLGARDTLRLESCYSLYGHELNDEISPIEAGLGWLVNSTSAYIGKKSLETQKKSGAGRSFIVFTMKDRGIPRESQRIFYGDKEIGTVTSGTFSPTFQIGIGMGLVETNSVTAGDEIRILVREKKQNGVVVRRPLYSYGGAARK